MPYLTQDARVRRRRAARRARRRRRLVVGFTLIAATVAAAVLIAQPQSSSEASHRSAVPESLAAGTEAGTLRGTSSQKQPSPLRIAPAHPGTPKVILQGPARREIALTIDDGACASCVARIIHTLARTGAHATIFPNGRYSASWDPPASTIRRLVAAGQLTIGNHTYMHRDARLESAAALQSDLAMDESWIEKTFHVSTWPFFRPPYGAYDSATLAIAGRLGYTKVVIWSGTVADSTPHTVGYVLGAIRHWARPGAIILMHGNYPATSLALPRILSILRQRHLRPVTLAQLLG